MQDRKLFECRLVDEMIERSSSKGTSFDIISLEGWNKKSIIFRDSVIYFKENEKKLDANKNVSVVLRLRHGCDVFRIDTVRMLNLVSASRTWRKKSYGYRIIETIESSKRSI